RLHEARGQAEEIVKRARQTADAHEQEARERAQQITAEGSARAAREIEEATRRALRELREGVAELTVLAAEKATRKTLDEADRRRGLRPAAAGVPFLALLLHAGEEGRADARAGGRGPGADALPGPAGRKAPHAGPVPHPLRVREPVRAGRTPPAGRDHERRGAR